MRGATADSALLLARKAVDSAAPSQLEQEVVELFDQLRGRLLRYTLNFGVPVQDGEEIIQEVFLALFQHLQQGKPRENLRGWVFRVAHNLTLKRRASLSSMGTSFSAASFSEEQFGEESALFADPAPNPEAQSASNQAQRQLLAVFRVLPEQDRRCLILRAEGLRYREIGQVLGMSLGAVSMSLSRSLARMARAANR
jgi:RNA polymerase sigma-70 factor (ECF subfamily)